MALPSFSSLTVYEETLVDLLGGVRADLESAKDRLEPVTRLDHLRARERFLQQLLDVQRGRSDRR